MLLAVEVANSSLRYDLDRKPRIYADIGVRELWVIDVASRIVHRHAEPTSQGYAQIVRCAGADLMTPLHAPAEFAFALDALEPL